MADAHPPSPPADLQRSEFGVMGTFGELLLRADPDVAARAFAAARSDLERVSSTLTRFDPASPIETLNDAGGGRAGELLREVLVAALRAFHDTGGLVDVGLGRELVAAGYDRDFDRLDTPDAAELRARHDGGTGDAPDAGGPGDAGSGLEPPLAIDLDGTVRIRAGSRLDLGGIAKGWAADRVRAQLAAYGSCLVNLGGDISVHVAPGDQPWPVGLELGDGWGTWSLAQGGVATSGQDRRVWRTPATVAGGVAALAHHLIDPRTGLPALTDVLRVSVFGATCLDAEVWAKSLLLRGCDAACALADRLAIPAIVVGTDGATRYVGVAPPA